MYFLGRTLYMYFLIISLCRFCARHFDRTPIKHQTSLIYFTHSLALPITNVFVSMYLSIRTKIKYISIFTLQKTKAVSKKCDPPPAARSASRRRRRRWTTALRRRPLGGSHAFGGPRRPSGAALRRPGGGTIWCRPRVLAAPLSGASSTRRRLTRGGAPFGASSPCALLIPY